MPLRMLKQLGCEVRTDEDGEAGRRRRIPWGSKYFQKLLTIVIVVYLPRPIYTLSVEKLLPLGSEMVWGIWR